MKNSHARIYDLLFVVVLILSAWFRFTGVNWDQSQHLHPDERFMTMVVSSMTPVKSVSEYFNTDTSTLNPNNTGYTFYVYGDWPITIVRYVADWMTPISTGAAKYVSEHGTSGIGAFFAFISQYTNWAGYDEVSILGRILSGIADLGTIFLLYLIGKRIYGRKVALLAAAFSAVAVMQIQQSHFFTVDNFANFFMFLTVYFAVEIGFAKPRIRAQAVPAAVEQPSQPEAVDADNEMDAATVDSASPDEVAITTSTTAAPDASAPVAAESLVISILRSAVFWQVVCFGIAVGMAVASKINAAPLVLLLPVALLTRYFQMKQFASQLSVEAETPSTVHRLPSNTDWQLNTGSFFIKLAITLLVVGAVFSAVSFRVFQPYAFKGPSFFNVGLNQKWLDTMKEQQAQATGDPDAPPSLQWARRTKLYSVDNIVRWGLGWPLGILALLGLAYMTLRMVMGEGKHFLLWFWTLGYLGWQSMQDNPTMRYQLPIYPLLALMAAWLALMAFERSSEIVDTVGTWRHRLQSTVNGLSFAMPIVGLLTLAATGVWAFAFVHIYTVDHSRVAATRWIYQNVPGPFNLKISQSAGDAYNQPMPYQSGPITAEAPYDVQFTARATGKLQNIVFPFVFDPIGVGQQTVKAEFTSGPGGEVLSTATLTADFAPIADPRGASYTMTFDNPPALEKDKDYFIHFTTTGSIQLSSVAPANESTWDDGLPLRMGGYDGYAGIYQGDHNFEMYWDDNADKLARFTSNLDSSDYIFISSNRQWGTTTRIPERYPLTIAYYRNLLGCPAPQDVITCYNTATPETFKDKGTLGYDLVKVFESFPTIGTWRVNDQFADEAFTVYDHPKVLIFKKRADYSPEKAAEILGAIDLTKVVHLTPLKAASYRELMLPADKLKADQAGGTWSDLFSYEAVQNKYPVVGLLIWYLAIAFLGWLTYFFLRLLLPGLADRGYPLARIAGLLLLAYFAWMVGSLGGEYSRLTIGIGYGLIVLTGLAAAWFKRDEVIGEIRSKAKYFLTVEGIFLIFFLIDLFIRFGNPDLWHDQKGGERPMDFAYLNAVIKSTSFPPYDPWFSGGYINYYYWGFVLVGTPIKLLGIVPSLAFNFVLPTLFAMLAMGGFSVVWNLVAGIKKPVSDEVAPLEPAPVSVDAADVETVNPQVTDAVDAEIVNPQITDAVASTPETTINPQITDAVESAPVAKPGIFANSLQWISSIFAGVALVLLGNLTTVRMIVEGLQRMAVSTEMVNDPKSSLFDHLNWFFQGIQKLLVEHATFPFYPGDWYWTPSRTISTSGSEITEFPLFTFTYSDLHAHMIALSLTVLVIAWALSMLLARNTSRLTWLGTLAFGGLVIGALRPTNTWDFPTYLALGSIVSGYAIFRYANIGDARRLGMPPMLQRAILAVLGVGLVAGSSLLFYQPFANWFAQGYNSLKPWTESRSPIDQYWSHWGFFLFILASWLISESVQWLASTPFSSLKKLQPFIPLIWLGVALFTAVYLLLIVNFKVGGDIANPDAGTTIGFNVGIATIAMPLLTLALLLLFRPGQPDVKRLVLFMIATGLAITIFVEVVVLDGDIGRMNTVFKFYLQVWVMFAISAAAAVGWLLSGIRTWPSGLRISWSVIASVLFASTLLFILTGTTEKMGQRMSPNGVVPPTLDSIDYMKYATYDDSGQRFELVNDYRAIRWMQDNIKGSPVVLEAAPAGVQYLWFSRISIYTGLPTVVGWQWHEEQQRTVMPQGIVAARGQEAQQFYRTTNIDEAVAFLKKYDVRYIMLGDLERVRFPEGLAKFDEQDKKLWNAVYRDGNTVIYQVVQ